MSIGFRMQTPEEVRVKLEKMSDAQLIEHGKTLRDSQPLSNTATR